ncbi:MAG: SRPBCC family protein, partial [Chthonomonadales bacterium]
HTWRMKPMSKSSFVYVTYIRTTPAKLWQALTDPEYTRQYWMGTHQECDWKVGSSWKLVFADGKVADAGEVVEIEPEKKLVLKWRNQFMPEMNAEGDTRMQADLEQMGDTMKLTIIHEMDRADSKFIGAVGSGWPMILASLKSLLESGVALDLSCGKH